ncbi:hypothetical protein FLK61_26570 [Paenalkalicoccus suaedae]|uniref:Uncharacterized protein n=2 Tax=Paenalkalicoccus suaedae TaxID=2592382 RepID=A0A859FAI3_9BACI|nr:hypothetical protein FLK61_26570 [Paenalkalicoccus suaedae]
MISLSSSVIVSDLVILVILVGVSALTGYLVSAFFKQLFIDIIKKKYFSVPLIGVSSGIMMLILFTRVFQPI